jgi:hypothetical protein
MQPFRIQPALDPYAYDTYAIRMPRSTHQRIATCEEVECAAWQNGWRTAVPNASPQAQYIRAKSERAFTEERDGALVVFTFKPGQRCFASDTHRVVLEREPVFLKQRGDWRTSGQMKALEPTQWLDEFAGNQERLSALHEAG